MSAPLLELREVFAVYRTRHGDAAALQGAELSAGRGEIICVQGPSGAGKTTLLRVVAGVQQPTAGRVLLDGEDIGRLGARARALVRHRRIGAIGQSATALPPDLPIEQSVALPLAFRGVARRVRATRALALLELVGLAERRGERPADLSGGERQRVALCAAIAHEPALLLADEPTGELDATGAGELLAAIAASARATQTTVIIASHDPATRAHADRTVTLRDGRIVEELRDGNRTLVVSQSGWVQLPEELRDRARIGDRVNVNAAPGELTLTAAGVRSAAGPPAADAAVSPGVASSMHSMLVGCSAAALGEHGWAAAAAELRGVRRAFTSRAGTRVVLDELSWEFRPGALTVVTGRSGSGKSTLLRLLCGLDRPDAGEVALDQVPIHLLERDALAALRRERIGYLPQAPLMVGFLNAAENVQLVLQIRRRARALDPDTATEHLIGLGLARRMTHRAETLSAGELQRVGLARALVAARGLVIADEPTSRLDRANAAVVAGWLAAAATRHNHTVICATHDPEVIAHADAELRLGG